MLVVQEICQIGLFDELVVSGKIFVDLEQGDIEQIIIESVDFLDDELNISICGGCLKLSFVDGWIKGDCCLWVCVQY